MAMYDPNEYPDENSGQDFFAPAGKYELYFSELGVGMDKNGNKTFSGKVIFVDGPRKGKFFWHTFGTEDFYGIYNSDSEKRKKGLVWMGNFFRAIGAGPTDFESDCSNLINKTFWGDVIIDDYKGKKSNKLEPWGFHASKEPKTVEKSMNAPIHADKPAVSSGAYEDDIPF